MKESCKKKNMTKVSQCEIRKQRNKGKKSKECNLFGNIEKIK